MMRFADHLNNLLHEHQLRQADLCRMTGIQTSLMSDYISGKKSPAIGNAILIADALHISLDALVGKKPLPAPHPSAPIQALVQQAQALPEKEQLLLLDIAKVLKAHT